MRRTLNAGRARLKLGVPAAIGSLGNVTIVPAATFAAACVVDGSFGGTEASNQQFTITARDRFLNRQTVTVNENFRATLTYYTAGPTPQQTVVTAVSQGGGQYLVRRASAMRDVGQSRAQVNFTVPAYLAANNSLFILVG